MNIRIKLEIAKILNLDFEWSSSKKKEDKSDERTRNDLASADNTSDNSK